MFSLIPPRPRAAAPERWDTRRRGTRGDAAIITVFFILTILIFGAITLTTVVIANLRGTRDIAASSQALYAADSGTEYGRSFAAWVAPGTTPCTTANDVNFGALNATFDVFVLGEESPPRTDFPDPAPLVGNLNPPPLCPALVDIQTGNRQLCVTAFGDARGKIVRRRVNADTNAPIAGSCR